MISYSDHSHSLISSSPPTAATTTYLLLKSFKGCPLSWIYGQTSSHYFHTLLLGGAFQVVSVWKQGHESRTLKCLEIYRFCPLLVPICRPTKSNPLISSCFSLSVWAPSLLGQLRYFFHPIWSWWSLWVMSGPMQTCPHLNFLPTTPDFFPEALSPLIVNCPQ